MEFGLQLSDVELKAAESSVAFGGMDLLTVVTHEQSHVLGFASADSEDHDLMSETMGASARKIPREESSIAETSPKLISLE